VPEVSPTVRRRQLGERLRQLRLAAGLTGEQMGARIERSASWISRVESGRIGVRAKELREILDCLHVSGAELRRELETLAEQGRQRGWWSEYRDAIPESYYMYVGYEAEASYIDQYAPLVVPGLLQTEGYATAVHEAAMPQLPSQLVRRRVALRMRRQEIAIAREMPVVVVFEESALRRVVGDLTILCDQLDAVLSLASDSITVRLVKSAGDASANIAITPFVIVGLPDDSYVVYREDQFGASFADDGDVGRYLELFRKLRAGADSPEESRARIKAIRSELCR
jgi:transcriptional regulator with XRE-family HTH domain